VRLFVAFTPSAVVLSEIESVVSPLRESRPDLRWASPQSWHVTLAFLGEVPEQITDRLAARLERAAARHPGIVLRTTGGGAFPTAPRARVLWMGIHGDAEALRMIAKSVGRAAGKAGAPSPDGGRPFRPHITLARCKEPADVRPLVAVLKDYSGSSWTADRIHLIRSYLGPHPRYEAIGTWSLKPPAGSGVGCQT
jgi:RNA 2',3'-cyclic 3'-phosphodiesterase